MSHSLVFERMIKAPTSEVYHALTNSSRLREWMCDLATTDPKVNGRIYLAWFSGYYCCGHFTSLEKDRTVAYTWYGKGEPRPTLVAITLSSHEEGTKLVLEHSEIGEGAEWEQVKKNFTQGWESGLGNLVSILETGLDLRIVRRPMLGIFLDDFDAEIAQKLGVPVSEGIRLGGVVNGMGAQAAGLQVNDVLVRIGNVDIKDSNALGYIIGAYQAGDVVEVAYYRGAELKSASMKLSGRPLPQIPASPAEMATMIEKTYAETLKKLSAVLKGVSEEEASFKPAPDEWSAKEVLAHLIHSERGWQNSIGEMVGGFEPIYDDWGNLPARNDATIAAFSTTRKLLAELKALYIETVALIANLPEVFVERKSTYWRLGYQASQIAIHLNNHLEQIQAALKASRR